MKHEECNMKYQNKELACSMLHPSFSMNCVFRVPSSILNGGTSLVEAIIAIALILLSLTGLVTAYSFYLKAGLKNTDNLKAAFLLQEGVEAATLLRDDSWISFSALTAGTPYYLSWNGTKWVATTTVTLADGVFKRTMTLANVYRKNSGQDIVDVSAPDAKTLDANTKKLTLRVVWNYASTTQDKQIKTYLTNLFE